MDNDRSSNGVIKVSNVQLSEASDKITRYAIRINELLRAAIRAGESIAERWQGEAADEFKERCASYKAPAEAVTVSIVERMKSLEQITGVYEDVDRRVKGKGQSLPSDVIS